MDLAGRENKSEEKSEKQEQDRTSRKGASEPGEGVRGQLPSHPASLQERVKVRNTAVRKGKSPVAKGSLENFKTLARNKSSLCT